MRTEKINYYLDIAQTVSERSTCIRRRFGAIIVKNDTIISTGYNGSPRGAENCNEVGECVRAKLNVPHGERYELCRSVHAEANAIISASRMDMLGADMYLCCTSPSDGAIVPDTTSCDMCRRLIINAGIKRLYVRDSTAEYRVIDISDWIRG